MNYDNKSNQKPNPRSFSVYANSPYVSPKKMINQATLFESK
jgi:hypothetical protein